MTIDWASFTPLTATAGGALIGAAAALLLLMNGRIAGISGILGTAMQKGSRDRGWRIAFIAGLMLAPWLWSLFAALPSALLEATPAWLVIAGLLVGFGSRLGSGCTSGHGVCGIARLSPRSLMATATFMATGFLMVYLLKHVIGGGA
ncbi:MAG: YeeE/YedE family protein [Rhodocyclaceae bacterium]|jgi:hypothetical protein|nr:YeeE/YedE family protein [Rhodocyclaceae bacterium]